LHKLLVLTGIGAVPVALAVLPPTPFDLERDVACVMPEGCLLYVEAPGFADLCDQGLEHPLLETLLASPLGGLVQEEVGMPLPFALGMANMYVGRPVLPSLAKLSTGGVALGVLPSGGPEPTACVVARGDAAEWEAVLELVMNKLADAQELPDDARRRVVQPHREVRGMDVWLLGDFGALALKDGLFLGATDEATLRRMIDLGAAEGLSGLAAREDFQAARQAYRSEAAFLWGWFDLDGLEAAMPGSLSELRGVPTQPGAQLVLGPALSNLGAARSGAAEVRFFGDRIELDLTGLGTPDGVAAALLPPAGQRPPALPAPLENETARGVLYRDLEAVFRDRVELFPVEAQPAFAEATSGFALFFGGQDLTDEVLPLLDPWIGLIARPVEFDERAVPEVPLPAAAVLLRTRDPERMGPQLVTAVQSLLAVLNIEAAQNQEPILTSSLELHEGIPITYGRYRTPDEGEGVDLRYNLEPACAMVGDTFVLGTHRGLVRELVGQLQRGETVPQEFERLELSGPELCRVIDANEEALVLSAILEEGKTEDVARKELRELRLLMGLVEAVSLETSRPAERHLRASVTLHLEGGR